MSSFIADLEADEEAKEWKAQPLLSPMVVNDRNDRTQTVPWRPHSLAHEVIPDRA
jgi:hypothetical protein